MKALVLAGGFPQISLIQELKNNGINVILADYFENPIAKPYADMFYQISTLDIPAIYELAVSEKVDFIITACTDQALLTVAYVSEKLNLPCYINYETAKKATNKSLMKEVFYDNDIPTSSFIILNDLNMTYLNKLSYPLVVKPVDCNSSKGVTKVHNNQELQSAFKNAIDLSRSKQVIVEEFVEGSEITVDVIIKNKKAIILSKAYTDKVSNNDNFIINRTRFPICEPSCIHSAIEDVAQKIADAYGLDNSLMLIQLISDGQRISVIEFSVRTGGCIKHKLIEQVSGVDVIKTVVDLTFNKSLDYTIQKPISKYITNLFIYCTPGIFNELIGFKKLKENNIIYDYYLFKNPGAHIGAATNSGDRIAAITLHGNTLNELQEKYETVKNSIKVLDINHNDIMRHDLLTPLHYKE